MTQATPQVLIVGGGIGGLAAACALAQHDIAVTVLERSEAIREVGAGIQVSPNGLRVIEALGLARALLDTAPTARAVSLRDYANGAEVARLDLGLLPPEQTYSFVHRADLVALLAKAAQQAGACIRTGAHVTAVTAGTQPSVTLDRGETLTAPVLIGADGLHSVLRPALNGPAQARFTGQVAWRAIVPNVVDHPSEARVHMAPGRHLVSYPLRDGAQVNLVAVQERAAWAEEGWQHTDDPAHLAAAFADFDPKSRRLIAEARSPGLWGLFRHPVAEHWAQGGTALLGDAAHPTLPFLAQGANMALEDAWVLAAHLVPALSQPDRPRAAAVEQALKAYQSARQTRARRIVDTATGNAWKYHLPHGPVRGVAHLGLRLASRFAPARLLTQFDWLYAHDVTRTYPIRLKPESLP